MKTRIGFVSNSSSASFVVALKTEEKPCAHCGRSDPNFLDIVEAIGARFGGDSECTQLHERGSENLRRYVERQINEDEWRDDTEKKQWKEIVEFTEKAEKKGYTVARIEISYHDEVTNKMFRDLEERKILIPLWSDHRDISLREVKL